MTTGESDVPPGVGAVGSALWGRIVGEFALDAHELPLLVEVVTAADRLAELRAVVAADGAVLRDVNGVPRVHPAQVEWRLTALAQARLLSTLNLPADGSSSLTGVVPGRSRAASKAATARWRASDGPSVA